MTPYMGVDLHRRRSVAEVEDPLGPLGVDPIIQAGGPKGSYPTNSLSSWFST